MYNTGNLSINIVWTIFELLFWKFQAYPSWYSSTLTSIAFSSDIDTFTKSILNTMCQSSFYTRMCDLVEKVKVSEQASRLRIAKKDYIRTRKE